MEESAPHTPVLLEEVRDHLVRPGVSRYLDGTVGAGGHAEVLLRDAPAASLLGLDRDPSALEAAQERLAPFAERALLVHAAFADASEVARLHGQGPFDGILLDLGVSSMQFDRPERGFSFQRDGPLDMRMDPTGPVTARELLARLDEPSLADLIYELGEERYSRRIARAVVEARRTAPLETTTQLAELVFRAVPAPRRPRSKRRQRRRLHPATRTFQALRMAVNDELGQLDQALPALFDLLAPEGRLAVISFHSLEDRRVKRFFKARKAAGEARLLTKKPLRPDDAEVSQNPRARSAKMRVAERLR